MHLVITSYLHIKLGCVKTVFTYRSSVLGSFHCISQQFMECSSERVLRLRRDKSRDELRDEPDDESKTVGHILGATIEMSTVSQ